MTWYWILNNEIINFTVNFSLDKVSPSTMNFTCLLLMLVMMVLAISVTGSVASPWKWSRSYSDESPDSSDSRDWWSNLNGEMYCVRNSKKHFFGKKKNGNRIYWFWKKKISSILLIGQCLNFDFNALMFLFLDIKKEKKTDWHLNIMKRTMQWIEKKNNYWNMYIHVL